MKYTTSDPLRTFRHALYHTVLTHRADALFELLDALLCQAPLSALAELSLCPAFHRGWNSVYDALVCGRLDHAQLMQLWRQAAPRSVLGYYAYDGTDYPRPHADTSPDRTFVHSATHLTHDRPVVIGYDYQVLVRCQTEHRQWVTPLSWHRLPVGEDKNAQAMQQLAAVLPSSGDQQSVVAFDAGYCSLTLGRLLPVLQQQTGHQVTLLIRVRADRVWYFDPEPGSSATRHGHKLVCPDPSTWPTPTEQREIRASEGGPILLQRWGLVHSKPKNGGGTPAPPRGWLVRVTNPRLPQQEAMWLWVVGDDLPLANIWFGYRARFSIEHFFRFLKHRLHWTMFHPRLPDQVDRWTDLVMTGYHQLWLARTLVEDQRLPWQRPQPDEQRTPYRVHQAMAALFATMGSPASGPYPCGRTSPGRPPGKKSPPAPRYPPQQSQTKEAQQSRKRRSPQRRT